MAINDFFKKNAPLIVTLLVCVCAICTIYSNALNTEFVFDDKTSILNNYSVRMESINVDSILTSMKNTRPLPTLSFAINYYFGGYSVQGYHIVNIVIHIINSVLIFFLFSKLLINTGYKDGWERRWVPVLTACLWAVNPVHVQSVTYIVQRMTSIATMFYLASFIFYLTARTVTEKKTKKTFFILSVIAGILSILSKEMAVTLPFFILLYDWLFFRDADTKLLKKYILPIVVFSLFTVIIGFFSLQSIYSDFIASGYSDYNFDMIQRCLTQFRVVIYYIGLLLFPHPSRLNIDYDFTVSNSTFDPFTTLIAIFMVSALILGALYIIFFPPHDKGNTIKRKKINLIAFCILWYFGNLFIESSFIPLDMIFEHRTYLPSILFFLMITILLLTVLKNRITIVTATIICMLICSNWTIDRNKDWKTKKSIWIDASSKSPDKARPYINIGTCYSEDNDFETAFRYYSKALTKKTTRKTRATIYINFGTYYYSLGQYNSSLSYYNKALELQKNDIEGLAGIGSVLVKLKEYKRANEYLNKVIKTDPNYIQAHASMGEMYLEQNIPEKALEHYNIVLKLNCETAGYYYNRGAVYLEMGKTDLAIEDLNKAIFLDNKYTLPHIALGRIYSSTGDYDNGIYHFKQAVKINPVSIDSYHHWAVLLQKAGNIKDAIYHYNRIFEIDPENIRALRNIGKLYYTNKDYANSLQIWEKILTIKPGDLMAMDSIASCYMADKLFSKAANTYNNMLQIQPENQTVLYNLACAYSESGEFKKSVKAIKSAISMGFSDIDYMKKDPDLSRVMGSDTGKKLLYELSKNGL